MYKISSPVFWLQWSTAHSTSLLAFLKCFRNILVCLFPLHQILGLNSKPMHLLFKAYIGSKKGIWHLARKADISIYLMNPQLAFVFIHSVHLLMHATNNLHFLLGITVTKSACSHQDVPISFCLAISLMKSKYAGRRPELQPQPPVSPAAEHRSPGSPRLSSQGLKKKAAGWIMPLGSPWGSSCSLNFRRLKEAQGKGISADQSQNPDHLTTYKSFK